MAFTIELATPSGASADWLYDFNSPPGETFFVFPNYHHLDEPPPPTFEYSIGDGVLRMYDDNPLSSGGAERAKALDDEVFSDVRVTAVINPNGETTHGWLGVLARSSVADPSTGYWVALGEESNRGRLGIGKTVLGSNVTEIIGSTRVGVFATQYLLRLDAVNKEEYVEVVGALLDVSSGQEIDRLEFRDYGTPLHAQQRSGSSGVFGGISDSSLNLTFGMASSVTIAEPLLGDLNLDGEVNGLDVDPFVDVLLSGLYQPEADMNEDQVINGLDVDPFVASVIGGVQQIPEPSTFLLALVALGLVGGWRKWACDPNGGARL